MWLGFLHCMSGITIAIFFYNFKKLLSISYLCFIFNLLSWFTVVLKTNRECYWNYSPLFPKLKHFPSSVILKIFHLLSPCNCSNQFCLFIILFCLERFLMYCNIIFNFGIRVNRVSLWALPTLYKLGFNNLCVAMQRAKSVDGHVTWGREETE